MAMPLGSRHLAGSLLLVTVAIVGLLSMHGLDGAVASLAEPAQSAHGPTADGMGQGTLRICVFVAAIAGLGIAGLRLTKRSMTSGRFSHANLVIPQFSVPWAPSRSRLIHLCVLRL